MKHLTKKGFTAVEIIIVLAIATVMTMAFMATISSRVSRERYSDATKSFADFLRKVYSEVESVENGRTGSISDQNKYCTLAGQAAALNNPNLVPNNNSDGYVGRSGCAIYGKLISVGEGNSGSAYTVYDVIGRAIDFRSGVIGENVIGNLKAVYADVLSFIPNPGSSSYSLKPAGSFYPYNPTSDVWLENTSGQKFRGEILIVRSPASGAVHTYWMTRVLDYQSFMTKYQNQNASALNSIVSAAASQGFEFAQYLNGGSDSNSSFVTGDIDFCVNSRDVFVASRKNDIRIKADGHNSSAVEIVKTDSGDNRCGK